MPAMSATLPALRATRDRISSLRDELSAELERRRHQVVELVDSGEDRRAIAEAGGVSGKTICVALKEAGLWVATAARAAVAAARQRTTVTTI